MKKAILVMLAFVLGLLLCACAANQPGDSGCTHEWQAATCTTPKTCTKCGATEGSAVGHNWKDATCTEPKTCTKCNKTDGAALNHDWKDATCTEPKTCTKCGATEGSAVGHNWKEATCTAPKTCSKCNEKEGSVIGHLYSNGKCLQCGAKDPKYVQVSWRDIFSGQPEITMSKNSAGGLKINWAHKYTGGKTVNYVTITFTLIDAVGNPIADEIKHQSKHSIKLIGPWSGDEIGYYGSAVWVYCAACNGIKIESLTLEYADGTYAVCTYGWTVTFSR